MLADEARHIGISHLQTALTDKETKEGMGQYTADF